MNTDHPAATTRLDAPPEDGCCHPEVDCPEVDCPDQPQATIALTLTQVADLVELLDEIDQFLRLSHHSIDALTDFYRTHHDDNHPRFVALCLVDSVSFTALSLRGRARAAGNHPAAYSATYSGADQ
jgi:hypothetical protein